MARMILNVGPPISLLNAGITGKCLALVLVDLPSPTPALYMFDSQSNFKVPYKRRLWTADTEAYGYCWHKQTPTSLLSSRARVTYITSVMQEYSVLAWKQPCWPEPHWFTAHSIPFYSSVCLGSLFLYSPKKRSLINNIRTLFLEILPPKHVL